MFPEKPMTAALAIALAALALTARAADAGKLPCGTTEQCAEHAAKIGAFVPAPSVSGNTTSKNDQSEDQFFWMNKINKASAVVLVEAKILPREMGGKLAQGVSHTIDQAGKPGGKRPSDVMQIERILTDAIGPEGSLIHAGRSRQDMYATYRMARLRNQVLDFYDALSGLRDRFLVAASQNVDTIVPAYTNGVQAQPISYSHYLLAYASSFERDAQRVQELYKRMNRSAMGTAVLANSGWPLDRKRLADLLGFDGVIENSLDSSQVSPSDISLEATSIASSVAIRLSAILADVHTQYHQTRPWLLLDEGSTYTSSAMPQKRNPGLIMRARESASNVVGLSQTVTLRAHNVSTGMTDYKEPAAELGFFAQAVKMLAATNAVFDALTVNPKRALEELEDDWTTSMEVAEVLQKDHGIPFRVGHTFASDMVTFARANGIRPKEFPYPKAAELYAAATEKYKVASGPLPVKETDFRKVLSPAHMVKSRVGIGGPQPQEVARMLRSAQAAQKADKQWSAKARQALKDADARLEQAFRALL